MKLPGLSIPVLTTAEKTALGVLAFVLVSGGALRMWERSGVKLGPVKDWDSLRKLVVQAHQEAGNDTIFPCFEPHSIPVGDRWPQRARDSTNGKGISGKKPPAEPLDINSADARSLRQLPRVGPSMAAAIVSYRIAHGRFKSIEDLLDVKGLGPKKFSAMKKFISIGMNVKKTSVP